MIVPPACNTGVHPPADMGSSTPPTVFDWYRATVPVAPDMLTKACLGLAGPHARIVDGKGRFNYTFSRTIEDGGERVATILHGGSNGHPNVEASGDRAPALAELLRRLGPHRVTRCDPCVDLYGAGLFEELMKLVLRIADEFNLQTRLVASPTDPDAGRTLYAGSRKSAIFLRLYEKGKAERGRYGDLDEHALDHWVRVELEVKPQKEMKERAAILQPADFWGCSAWTAKLAQEAFSMAPEPIPFHPRRTASDERAYRFMVAQYRNLMMRRCKEKFAGDREAFARQLAADFLDEDHDTAAA